MYPCTIHPLGDTAVTVAFQQEISPKINHAVTSLRTLLEQENLPGIVEYIPTYASLTICYDPSLLSYRRLKKTIQRVSKEIKEENGGTRKVFRIPVCYGGAYGEDMERVRQHTGLSENEIIQRHSAPAYLIYMLGFLPGFSYLGGLDASLHTPRLKEPRTAIPIGSVGIGGAQTGIYPLTSPGGWNLIGRTPVHPYNAEKETILYQAGDYIRFVPITPEEYQRIEKEIEEGTYTVSFDIEEDV